MIFFPCNIDIYTIIKDILTTLIIPVIGIYFAHFYIRIKKEEIKIIETKNKFKEKIKKTKNNIIRICKKLCFKFNDNINEFEYKYGNGTLYVRLPLIIEEIEDIYDNPFFLVHWEKWLNKNHISKSIDEQKKEGIPFEDDYKNLEEYIQKLIDYRKKQNNDDVE
jgi:purine-cytosine permease-like protein